MIDVFPVSKTKKLLLSTAALSIVGHSAVLTVYPFASNQRVSSNGSGITTVYFYGDEATGDGSSEKIGRKAAGVPPAKLFHQHRAMITGAPTLEKREGESVLEEGEGGPAVAAGRGTGNLGVFGEEEVDVPASLLAPPKLIYPRRALQEGEEGDVTLFLVVDSRGNVLTAEVTDTAGGEFDESALQTARTLKFSPAQKAGEAVSVHLHWICRFRIEG
jgi:TonB family protein